MQIYLLVAGSVEMGGVEVWGWGVDEVPVFGCCEVAPEVCGGAIEVEPCGIWLVGPLVCGLVVGKVWPPSKLKQLKTWYFKVVSYSIIPESDPRVRLYWSNPARTRHFLEWLDLPVHSIRYQNQCQQLSLGPYFEVALLMLRHFERFVHLRFGRRAKLPFDRIQVEAHMLRPIQKHWTI